MKAKLLLLLNCLWVLCLASQNKPTDPFTVVSYNVENLFDQKDNFPSTRETYRIAPNSKGYRGNYGQKVLVNGKRLSWTEVKIANIRKVLTDIDPEGPAIVALQEIENKEVLAQLRTSLSDLGYIASASTHRNKPIFPIGNALLSKFPIKSQKIIYIPTRYYALFSKYGKKLRPILKVTLDVQGNDLVIYNCHFKSKGPFRHKNPAIPGYAYFRVAAAKTLEKDLQPMLAKNPYLDYLVLGDLNEDYNEKISMDRSRHDHILSPSELKENRKLWSKTTMEILNSGGNEKNFFELAETSGKYNLHFELPKKHRKTAYHAAYDWSSFDHILVGVGLYNKHGIAYIDQSFAIGGITYGKLAYLLDENGLTKKWQSEKKDFNGDGKKDAYIHKLGGYSDHLPLLARFSITKSKRKKAIHSSAKASVDDRPQREIMEAYQWKAIFQKIDILQTQTGGQVLCVFDIDNTLLAMESELGSDQWWSWQAALQREARTSRKASPRNAKQRFWYTP